MTTPLSRVQILDVPIVAPGKCVLCGTSGTDDGRKFVDFGKQVDWYGAVYFCSECFAEVARAVGFVPVADFDALHTELRDLQAKKDLVDAKYSGVTSALDTLFANYGSGTMSIDSFVRGTVSTSEESEFDKGLDKEFATGESETNESDNVEGPDDFFDDSDFDD